MPITRMSSKARLNDRQPKREFHEGQDTQSPSIGRIYDCNHLPATIRFYFTCLLWEESIYAWLELIFAELMPDSSDALPDFLGCKLTPVKEPQHECR